GAATDIEQRAVAERQPIGQDGRDVLCTAGKRESEIAGRSFLFHRGFHGLFVDEGSTGAIGAEALDKLEDSGRVGSEPEVIGNAEIAAGRELFGAWRAK